MSGSPLINKILKADDVGDMKVPGENGEEVRIIAQSQFDVNQENTEGADLIAQARETDRSTFAERTVMLQRVRIDALFETFLGFNNFRVRNLHETGKNMRGSSREIYSRLVQPSVRIGGQKTKVGRKKFEGPPVGGDTHRQTMRHNESTLP